MGQLLLEMPVNVTKHEIPIDGHLIYTFNKYNISRKSNNKPKEIFIWILGQIAVHEQTLVSLQNQVTGNANGIAG